MENITYGYVRVSSKDQNIERQLIALKNAGISEKHIYIFRQSGKNFNRPAYKSMLRKLKSGDIIVTKSIDRLGRNYEEIIEQKDCLSLKKLAVNGRDLMELGIKPGKKIGQILQKLLEEVLEEPDKNKKEYLLERVKQTYQ